MSNEHIKCPTCGHKISADTIRQHLTEDGWPNGGEMDSGIVYCYECDEGIEVWYYVEWTMHLNTGSPLEWFGKAPAPYRKEAPDAS